MSTTTTSGQHSCPMMNFAPRAVAAFVSAGSLFLLLCLAQCQVCNGFHHQHQARIIGTRVPVGVQRRQHQRSSSTGKIRPPPSSPPLWEVGAVDRRLLPRRTDEHSLFLPLQLSRKDNEEEESLPTRGGFWGRARFWRRRLLDPVESAGYDGDAVQAQGGIFGRIKRVHDPITYLAVALIAGLRMEWCFRNPYYWFGVGFCIKWFRARYVFKIPVWDRQPNWNNIITSKEQEKDLKAYTCKKCGSTIFIAKTREFFFEGSTGIGGLGCFSCGAKGKENFVMDRDRIVEDVADLDDYFEYERPLDFVSRAERRKLLKESGGDEDKANQLILERAAAAAAAAEEEQQTKQQQEDDPLTILDATVIEEDTVVVETENKGEAAVVQSDDETVDQATDQEEEPEVAGSASSEAAAPPPADAAQSEIVMDAEIDATESSTVSDASKGTESAASATEKEESENASSDQEQQAVVKQGEISSSITPPPPPPPTPPVAENNNPASSSSSDNDDAQQEDDVSLDALGMDDF